MQTSSKWRATSSTASTLRLRRLLHTARRPQRLTVIPAAMEHILQQPDGKKRYMDAVTAAVARRSPWPCPTKTAAGHPRRGGLLPGRARRLRQDTRPAGTRSPGGDRTGRSSSWSRSAIASGEVINIFDAAGLKAPDISILSDEFLAEVAEHAAEEPGAGTAAQAAQRRDQGARSARTWSRPGASPSMLEDTIRRYQQPQHRHGRR